MKESFLTGLLLFFLSLTIGCSENNAPTDTPLNGDQDTVDGTPISGDVDDEAVDGDNENSQTTDPCNPNPCSDENKTNCSLEGNDGFLCSCDDGFEDYGDGSCKPSYPCNSDNVCSEANRVCSNDHGTALCGGCLPGFHEEGENCAIDRACEVNSCNGNGDCDDSSGAIACTCYTGYAGDNCGGCDEANGWHWNGDGNECTTDPCDPDPCEASSHRICDQNTGWCVCESGYCDIQNVCVLDGLSNPENLCQKCDSSTDAYNWSPKPSSVRCRPAAGACDLEEYCDESAGICPEDAMMEDQESDIACGLNGRGNLYKTCIDGHWSVSQRCVDPDYCIDNQHRLGVTACGLNGRGVLEQSCENGFWSNTAICNDPDECEDDSIQQVSCGLNGRGSYSMECVSGFWRNTESCLDSDECRDNSARVVSCTMNDHQGSKAQACVSGLWQDTGQCITQIDVQVTLEETVVTQGLVHFSVAVQEPVVEAELFLDQESMGSLQDWMGRFTIPTTQFSDGSHSIRIHVLSEDGREGDGQAQFTVTNPTATILAFDAPETIYPSRSVKIDIQADGSIFDIEPDFSEIVSGFQQSSVSFASPSVMAGTGQPIRYHRLSR